MDALSPSTVSRDCSSLTLSPTATMISVTSTSSLPISGTHTSFSAAAAGAAAGAGAACAATGAAAAPSCSNTIISEPVDTLLPTCTLISFTIPPAEAGTSIEALSPSTVIRDCSASTLSPTLTRISVTSTSSAPISGTKISILMTGASYAYSGLTLSASIPNLAIASATTDLAISPRLASSVSAATTT